MNPVRRYFAKKLRSLGISPPIPPPLDGPQWALGILTGPSLFELKTNNEIRNPILSAKDITDRKALLLADPFLIRKGGLWYLFFEIFDLDLVRGVIGYATSADGKTWQYQGVVLEDKCHLSYPHVFEDKGEIYMIPETKKAREVRLYRATEFPKKWELCKVLFRGRYADASIIQYENRWWIFVSRGAYNLAILYADDLLGKWRKHYRRLFYIRDRAKARPGGRMITHEGKLLRFSQDCVKYYGHQVRAFSVEKLTPWSFSERELDGAPFLTPSGAGWNGHAMHHIDPHQLPDGSWMAVVDGQGE